MAERRKDSKNRVLRNGESQRKDGTYMYRYTDVTGKRVCVYARTLEDLRVKEQTIQKELNDGIDYAAGEIIVLDLLKRYIATKTGVRYNTKVGYQFVLESLGTTSVIWKENGLRRMMSSSTAISKAGRRTPRTLVMVLYLRPS